MRISTETILDNFWIKVEIIEMRDYIIGFIYKCAYVCVGKHHHFVGYVKFHTSNVNTDPPVADRSCRCGIPVSRSRSILIQCESGGFKLEHLLNFWSFSSRPSLEMSDEKGSRNDGLPSDRHDWPEPDSAYEAWHWCITFYLFQRMPLTNVIRFISFKNSK